MRPSGDNTAPQTSQVLAVDDLRFGILLNSRINLPVALSHSLGRLSPPAVITPLPSGVKINE